MSRDINDPEITRLEAALAGLTPAAPQIDRDALLFNAGRRSAARGRFWPCAASLFALIAVGLGAALAVRPGPQVSERVVFVQVPVVAPPAAVGVIPAAKAPPAVTQEPGSAAGWARFSAFALRQQALRWGVDSLPLASAGGPPLSAKEAPSTLPPVSSYYQLRLSLRTGGAL